MNRATTALDCYAGENVGGKCADPKSSRRCSWMSEQSAWMPVNSGEQETGL